MKKVFFLGLVLSMCCMFSACGSNLSEEEKKELKELNLTEDEYNKLIKEQEKCDFKIVTFGAYEQDNNKENGKEPIEWMVIYEDSEKKLLLSRYILDRTLVSYDPYVEWVQSDGYQWLNDTFFNTAFSEEERKKILYTQLEEEKAFFHDSSQVTLEAQNNFQPAMQAYVFYLSASEVEKYMYNGKSPKAGIVGYATEFCIRKQQNLLFNDKNLEKKLKLGIKHSDWWPTRTPYFIGKYIDSDTGETLEYKPTYMFVGTQATPSGKFISRDYNYYYATWSQRPAIYVKKG